jgi:hypothetical protein
MVPLGDGWGEGGVNQAVGPLPSAPKALLAHLPTRLEALVEDDVDQLDVG